MAVDGFTVNLERSRKDFFDLIGIISPRVWGWWRPLLNCGLIPLIGYASGIFLGLRMFYNAGFFPGEIGDVAIKAVTNSVILSVAVVVLLQLAANFVIRPKFLALDGEFLTPTTLRADDAGVTLDCGRVTRAYKWDAFFGLKKSKRGLLILTDHADGVYIPFSNFEDKKIAQAFETFVLRKLDGRK